MNELPEPSLDMSNVYLSEYLSEYLVFCGLPCVGFFGLLAQEINLTPKIL